MWSYSALVKGYVQGGDVARAREVLQQMQAAGVPGNEVSWNCLAPLLQTDRAPCAAVARPRLSLGRHVIKHQLPCLAFAPLQAAAGNLIARCLGQPSHAL